MSGLNIPMRPFAIPAETDAATQRVIQALLAAAIATGQSLEQFRVGAAAAGILPPHAQPQPDKLAVAVAVMELFAKFITAAAPDLLPDFVRVLERFTPYLAEELS